MEQNREPKEKHTYLQSINFWQWSQEYTTGKSLFSKWWENCTVACKSVKLKHTLTPCTKINSKCFKNLNIRHNTIKLLEENIGKTLSHINHTTVFLGQSPKAIEIKAKINKWDLIKLTSFFKTKETIYKMKKTSIEWEKIFANNATYRA